MKQCPMFVSRYIKLHYITLHNNYTIIIVKSDKQMKSMFQMTFTVTTGLDSEDVEQKSLNM